MSAHSHHDHGWWECEECHARMSERLDASLRERLTKQGVPERDADVLIKQARDEGKKLRIERGGAW